MPLLYRFAQAGRWLGAVLLPLWLCTGAGAAQPQVVVLHSYHQGLSWVDDINRGLGDTLGSGAAAPELHFEYLDAKRYDDPSQLEALATVLTRRYRAAPPAVVVVSDNAALEFVRARRDALFGPAPVVFCGINGYRPELLSGMTGVTGVAEEVSFTDNLALFQSLHPERRRIVVYGGGTPTYSINKQSLLAAATSLSLADRLEFVEGLNIGAIRDHARKLGADAAILLISVLRDDRGVPMEFAVAVEQLAAVAPVPLYGLWEFFLGHGTVGGRLVSGQAQGRAAGELVAKILAGASAEALPVRTASANPYLFDDRELVRWGIDPGQLPAGSEVRYRPRNFFLQHRELVWGVGFAFTTLLGLLALLLVDRHYRRRSQTYMQESRDFLQTQTS